MRSATFWIALSLLAATSLMAKDVATHDRAVLLQDLQVFELQFRGAERDGMMTHAKDLSVNERLAQLKAKCGLNQAPDGASLSDGQLEGLRVALHDLSGLLFHR